MLKSIRIRNYRSFKDCKIDDLGRINIFAGMNNSGKTTVLEALFLLSAAGNPRFAFSPTVVRVGIPAEIAPLSNPVTNVIPPAAGYMWSTAWQPMFHELATRTPIEIVGDHESWGSLQLTISTERSEALVLSSNADTSDHPDDLLFRHGRRDGGESRLIRIKPQGDTGYGVDVTGDFDMHFQAAFVGIDNITLDVERLSKLKKEKADASVLEAIQKVDASVKSIEIGVLDTHAVILADVGLSDRLPLQTLGAGPQRIATLATSAATVAGGVLLIDEFDAGLHHSKFDDVWRALHDIAVDRDVQVFATTHSYECVRSADEVLGDGEPNFYRLQDGQVTNYPPDVLADAIAARMEVR
ncbi:MAG: AAA family ATPase [Acidimicrobiaceae bacterium]|nr:AAA family ATPase [Acidimicrobiaceae bacterium]